MGDIPAWLASLIVHLIVFILLSLMPYWHDNDDKPLRLVLSTTISAARQEGDFVKVELPTPDKEFDPPLGAPRDGKPREVVLRAQRDAKALRLDPAATRRMPDVQHTKRLLESTSTVERTFAARDPRLRDDLLKHEGGTVWTEAAVARGLHWLNEHQSADGSWAISGFDDHAACRGRCDGTGQIRGRMAGTSLALLPFLGAGQSPDIDCKYRDTVARALRWILDQQNPQTGDLRGDADDAVGMYVHGQAAIVLCEAFTLTGNEALREPARKAVEFIVRAQHPGGGWRYYPGQEGDTSVHGWQVMALHSARTATVPAPDHVFRLADQFLDGVASRNRVGLYGYMPGQRETPAMTAEGLLCRFYLGAKLSDPSVRESIDFLVKENLPREGEGDFYYWYYATQVMHHVGGADWDRWNVEMMRLLPRLQETRGHEAGSWSPRAHYDRKAGRLYTTALATCTLEVYYRHTPIFRQIDLD